MTAIDATVTRIRELFFYQHEHYAKAWKSRGGDKVGYQPACAHHWNTACKERRAQVTASGGHRPCRDCPLFASPELTDAVIKEHIRGTTTLGAYQLREDGTVGWLCLDFDVPGEASEHARRNVRLYAGQVRAQLEWAGLHAYTEYSGSKGYHVWVFTPDGTPAADMQRLGQWATETVAEEHGPFAGVDVEVFPKQTSMPGATTSRGDFGNLVKVPLGVNLKSGNRAVFVDAQFNVVADQEQHLAAILTNTAEDVRLALADWVEAQGTGVAPLPPMPPPPPPPPQQDALPMPQPQYPGAGPLAQATVDLIRNGAAEGERNERLFRAACDLLGNGRSVEEAVAVLTPPMLESGLTEDEILQTVESAASQPRTPAVPPPVGGAPADAETEAHYEVDGAGRLVHKVPKPIRNRSGDVVEMDWQTKIVANFAPRIVKEVELRDGEATESTYTVAGFAARPFTVDVDGAAFRDERQCRALVGSAAGAAAIIYEPRLFPMGIQEISTDCEAEVRYTSIGWQQVNGRWQYITPRNEVANYDGPEELNRFGIGLGDFDKGAEALVHGLLEAFPHNVTYFAVAHAFLGPLFRFIKAGCKRYALHLVGETGSLKTTYACTLLCLYGAAFADEEPTEKWTSTANKIEVLGHHAKDALYLVDDYKPRLTGLPTFATVIHNYSDGRGRGRLNRDSSIQTTKFIRGALLTTGEDLPEREASVISRMVILNLPRPEGMNLPLRYAQDRAEHLNAVMYEFTQWLSEHEREIEPTITSRVLDFRDSYLRQCPPGAVNPGRLCTNLAQNRVAWLALARFLTDTGVWTEAEAEARLAEYDGDVPEIIEAMSAQIAEEKASEGFLTAIRALLDSGRAELLPKSELEPSHGKALLGWYDMDWYYLLPSVAYAEAQRWWRSIGSELGFSKRAIIQQLMSDNLIEPTDPMRPDVALRVGPINDQVKRVLKLKRDALDGTEAPVEPHQSDAVDEGDAGMIDALKRKLPF